MASMRSAPPRLFDLAKNDARPGAAADSPKSSFDTHMRTLMRGVCREPRR